MLLSRDAGVADGVPDGVAVGVGVGVGVGVCAGNSPAAMTVSAKAKQS
jgi:hypothetical protein